MMVSRLAFLSTIPVLVSLEGCAPPTSSDCDLSSGNPALSGAWALTLNNSDLGTLTVNSNGSPSMLRNNPDALRFFGENVLFLDCALHSTTGGMVYRAYGETRSFGDSVTMYINLDIYSGMISLGDMSISFNGTLSAPSRIEGEVDIRMNIPGFGDSITGVGVATRNP